uniref:Uncharacterized protein n=1 Tax=Ochrobactrum sp. SJY1 TaxID=1526653 RepID=A0A075XFJ8_9HYPH|nr:hypothetical protein [Ochrobactrum sp. SJY1]
MIRHFFSVLNLHQLSFIGFAAALSAHFHAPFLVDASAA